MSDVAASAVAPPPSTTPKLEGDALLDALRAQLEFYFSKQNLATDSYLLNLMNANANKSVPIDILAGFRKIKSLTDDKSLIIQALKQCKNLTLDEAAGTVRSALKVERSTLIVRDMPKDANEAELRAVFEDRPGSLCKGKIVSLTPEINDTWFVTFDSEKTCMDVCLDVQTNAFTETQYTYHGKPIQARVKNESLNRGFYTGPAPPAPSSVPSTVMVGGPVPGVYHPYAQHAQPFYYPAYMQAQGGYVPAPQGYIQPMVAPNAAPAQQTKAEKKAAAAQLAAANPPAMTKKEKKNAQKAAAAAAAAAGGAAPSADGPAPAAGEPKKKKKKAAATAAAAAVAAPAQPEDKSHLVALYGHAPRTYSREQIAQVVENFITMARQQGLKRPDGFAACNDQDKAVLKEKPSTTFSILDPFPVIYPASPSPLLAAQPHHSGSLPFLELGSGAINVDAPYFTADAGFTGQRRKSVVKGGDNKKPQQAGASANAAPVAGAAKRSGSPSQKARPASASAQQPKAASNAAPTSILGTVAAGNSTGAPSSSKPTSFAAAALAAGNAPQQPIQKIAPKAVAKPAPAAAATNANAQSGQGNQPKQGEKKAKKPKSANANANNNNANANSNGNNGTPSGQSGPAKPSVPVVNYASRVGVISPAEAAAKAAAQKQAKEAKDAAAAAAAAAEKAKDAKPAAVATGEKAKESNSNAVTSPSGNNAAASAKSATPESPGKAAFSYAAMIKKAPTVVSPPAPSPAKKDATANAAASTNSDKPKSEAGNWRAQ